MSEPKKTDEANPVAPMRSTPRPSVEETLASEGLLPERVDQTTDFGSEKHSNSSATPSPSSPQEHRSGSRSIGGYRLNELLGEGGMGRVYKGVDTNGRAVAVKLLSPQWTTSNDALVRFKKEGVIASQINHPNCVFVHRVDEDRGTPFIAMELMSGQTLKDLVLQRGPLPFKEAVRLILQCIDGLIEAHSQGMIHRDIKPANCYLDDQGNVKIGDFGLARSLVDDSDLTRTGAFLGTPLFASPEQVLGHEIDVRSDIYSLTVTLYYLLAGKAPFESPNAAQVIAKIASSDPPSFRELGVDVPKGLENIVMKGLARDRNRRYASFEALRADLLPIVAPEEGIASLRRRCVAAMIDMATFSFLSGVTVFMLMGTQRTRDVNPILGNFIQFAIAFFYYWIQESIFSATIGKRLLRLKVVDCETGGRQSVTKLAIRSASYVFLVYFVSGIYNILNNVIQDSGLIDWIGHFIGLGILYIGWQWTQRKQLTHEWLSGTQTRLAIRIRKSIPVQLAQPVWTLPLISAKPALTQIGRFHIDGQIQTSDESCWYVARDTSLDREVWIHLLTSEEPPLTEERKLCVRRTRMRVIESGTLEGRCWNAFLAPDGTAMEACVEQGITFPWPIARRIFHQLLEEHQQTGSDRLESDSWNLTRFWIDSGGRITFSEAAVLPEPEQTPHSLPRLLSQIAMNSLPALHRLRRKLFKKRPPIRRDRISINQLAPYGGLKLLERIAVQHTDVPSLQKELARVDESPEEVNGFMRFSHAAIASAFLLAAFTVAAVFLSIGGVIVAEHLRREARELATLAAVVHEPSEYEFLLKDLSTEAREQWLLDETKAKIAAAVEAKNHQLQWVYGNLGMMEKFFLDFISVDFKQVDQKIAPYPIRDLKGMKIPVGVGVEKGDLEKQGRLEVGSPNSSKPGIRVSKADSRANVQFNDILSEAERASHVTMASLEKPFQRWEQGTQDLSDASSFPVTELILYPLGAVILWLTIFRGGVFQMFSGVCIMRRDGCEAGFLQSFWRALVLFTPFVLLAWLVPYLEQSDLKWLPWTLQLKRLFIVLPGIYLAATLLWPQTAPHDKLSYTVMVPR